MMGPKDPDLQQQLAECRAELNEALARGKAVAEVLGVINTSPDEPSRVFQAVLEKAMALCGAAFGHLDTFDGERFQTAALHGVPDAFSEFRRHNPPRYGAGTVPARILAGETVVQVPDLLEGDIYRSGEPNRRAIVDLAGARAVLTVALRKAGRLLGFINVFRLTTGPFTDKQVELLQSFAAQAVIAMENARLLTEQREALDRQTATAEVLKVINASPGHLAPVFDAMLDKAIELCAARFGILFLRHDQTFAVAANRNVPPAFADAVRGRAFTAESNAVLRHLLENKRPLNVPDMFDESYRMRDPLRVAGIELGGVRSLAAVPLVKNAEVIGAIVIYCEEPGGLQEGQIALVSAFADQAVIAMENARLITEQREALEQQTATAEVLQVINSSPGDLTPVFEAMLEKAMRLCEASFGGLTSYDGERFHTLALRGLTPDAAEAFREPWKAGPGSYHENLVRGEPLVHADFAANDAARRAQPQSRALAEIGGARSGLLIALRKEDALLGSLWFYRKEVRPFTNKQIALLKNFADQAVIAMENARLLSDLRQRTDDLTESLEYQTATSELLEVISRSTADVEPVLDAMLASASRLCGVHMGAVSVRKGEVLHYVATIGISENYGKYLRGTPQRIDRTTAAGRAMVTKQVAYILDVQSDLEYAMTETTTLGGFRSLLAVPLLREDEVVGAITLGRNDSEPLTDRQIALVKTFADQAVIAMENARLLSELRQRTNDLTESLEYQTTTSELLEVISRSTSDIQPVLDTMLAAAGRLCDTTSGGIAIRQDDVFRYFAGIGLHQRFQDMVRTRIYRIDRSTAIGRVALSRGVVLIADARADPDYASPTADAAGVRTVLGVPLLREGEVIGVIVLVRDRVEPFTERQISLVKTFADQAVIAMENARLLSELRESLDQQTATAEVLQVINASPGDLAPVFDAMLDKAMHLCGADFGNFARYDANLVYGVAYRGVSDEFIDRTRTPFALHPGGEVERAVKAGTVLQVVDMRETESYRAQSPGARYLVDIENARTVVWVPLLKDERSLGFMVMFRREVRPFTDKQIALLKDFAAQAVIAMENARLLGELRKRTDDLTESLEYQTATSDVLQVISRSTFDLQPVLDTLSATAARLCVAELSFMTRRDDDAYRFVTAIGATPETTSDAIRLKKEVLDQHLFRPGRDTITGRVVAERGVVQIVDLAADADYALAALTTVGRIRTLLGVPLMRGNEVIGTMSLARQRVEPFTEKQIELVRTFADQAVIAMENARLLNETKEALERQTATADILKVIASSPDDLQPVFEAIAERSNKLVDGLSTAVYRLVDDMLHLMSFTPTNPEADAALRALFPAPVPTIFSEAVREGEIFRIADSEVELSNEPEFRELARLRGWRSVLMVPLLQDRKTIGLITVTRVEPGLFADQHVELLNTFADQAVIAISNVGLFQEVQQRTRELSASLEDLRAAQSRLVQSEKLASLGQLTAGIAHEIKNPLNFVNNFAGLSVELLQELKGTMDSAIAALSAETQAEIDEVIETLSSNLAKIVEHGKRADGIVRGMLEHSRGSTGERRSVDINGLVEEALNLAYHGARAQDQSFSITLQREFGPAIAPVELMPQDMMRVFLNLFGNGFYASRKQLGDSGDSGYRPVLKVSTRDLGESVEVRVRDNGTGIAPEVRDKVFQPFFTTKPTGEGTGLGLSISYDIVTHQHGGSIEVESEVGKFTEFTVRLPRARRAAA